MSDERPTVDSIDDEHTAYCQKIDESKYLDDLGRVHQSANNIQKKSTNDWPNARLGVKFKVFGVAVRAKQVDTARAAIWNGGQNCTNNPDHAENGE